MMKIRTSQLFGILITCALIMGIAAPQAVYAQEKKVPVVLTLAKGYKLLKVQKARKGVPLQTNQTRAFMIYSGKQLKIDFPGAVDDTLIFLKVGANVPIEQSVQRSLGVAQSRQLSLKQGRIDIKVDRPSLVPSMVGNKE